MSETLEKLFYRCFLIVSLFVFVFFPTEYYVQTYGDNETFWIPVFQVILQISGLLFLSWFVQNWSPKRRLAAVCLIPVLLFAVSVWLHVSTVLQYGLNTTQVSDFENAFVTSSVEPPIHSTWYQAFSSWASGRRYMDVEREVCELLRPFGITEKYIGVSQLALALQILLEDPECLHAAQKGIYMVIAERFCVNWKSIERNIRTLSTAAWRANPDYLELLAQYPLEKRPTSVQFMEIMLQNIRSKKA